MGGDSGVGMIWRVGWLDRIPWIEGWKARGTSTNGGFSYRCSIPWVWWMSGYGDLRKCILILIAGSGPWVGDFALKSIVNRVFTTERNLMRYVPEEVGTQHEQAPTNNSFPYAFRRKNGGGLQNVSEFYGHNLHERQRSVTHLHCLRGAGGWPAML